MIGENAKSLEELDQVLEGRFGPDAWKRIYESIPSREAERDNSSEKVPKLEHE